MSKRLCLVNPSSKSSCTGTLAPRLLQELKQELGEGDLSFDVEYTEHPAHAIELSRQAALSGYEEMIVLGGDGTLNEVVNGIMLSGKDCAIGLLSCGTGGDFKRSLGGANSPSALASLLKSKRTRSVDVGKIVYATDKSLLPSEERFFMNVASCGMGGLVDRYVQQKLPFFSGKALYFQASLRALKNIKPHTLKINASLQGESFEKELSTYMLAVCNGSFFGSGMNVAPDAAIDDGQFDVIVMKGEAKVPFFFQSLSIYKGSHIHSPHVEVFRADHVELTLSPQKQNADPCFLDVDGEALGHLNARFSVVPKAIRFFA